MEAVDRVTDHEELDAGASGTEPSAGATLGDHRRETTLTHSGLDERSNIFFAAIEMTRMPMILTDPNIADNPIVFANKAFLDLTGYEETEVLGRNCRFLQGPQTDRELVADLRSAVANRQSIALEILNYKRDGTPFWNAVFIGPVYDTGGKLLHFFASQLDVTRRRESEQASQQAQKMEAIGQLTAGLAHDFNNLLQVVNGNLELLGTRIEDEKQRSYLARARGAAERGAKLTGQLLAFARKTRLTPRAVDVNDCINGFADMLEASLGGRIELHLSLRRGLPKAVVDPEQLEMAILNIALNARDAMPGGGVLTIATAKVHLNGDAPARGLSPGDYISVELVDEGEGMAQHVIARAVEPFFTTKATGKGTGLGLAMASGFVLQSRGRLEIESEVGKGTTVRILFPVSTSDDAELPVAGPKKSVERGEAHILLVEDDAEVRALARENLEDAGYRVTVAENGDAGLVALEHLLATDMVDLVFTDLVMPGNLDGIALAEAVRRLAPQVPVLMTTGYNEDLVVEGPLRSERDVLGKPYRRADLLDRIAQALAHRDENSARRRPSDFGAAEE
ncbi:hybrid sensor histidine kinase/response regulator [Sphingopyxis sp. QXT-31]|uniref:histidine kinase famiy protein n=1 Tax=Sphingopyxis sp. QXT-31 TaxID=1357916 RepID=UPI000979080E|nr:histidine kinase famiy protein [Sphingopyxis sp. QXT-31]APZ97470.1 hybrid sensor histidine kinase/response regulator [Sphingopyxis sp. QXT-31]